MDKFSSLIFGDKPKKQKQSSSSTITTDNETPRLRPRKANKKKDPDGIDLDVSQDLPLISIPRLGVSSQQIRESITTVTGSESQHANPTVVIPSVTNPTAVNPMAQQNHELTNHLLLSLGQKLDSLEEKRKHDKKQLEAKLDVVSRSRNNRQNSSKQYIFKSKSNKIQHDMLSDMKGLSEEAKDLVEIGSRKRLASVLDDMDMEFARKKKKGDHLGGSFSGWLGYGV